MIPVKGRLACGGVELEIPEWDIPIPPLERCSREAARRVNLDCEADSTSEIPPSDRSVPFFVIIDVRLNGRSRTIRTNQPEVLENLDKTPLRGVC